MKNSPGLHI